jgi:hypothetical protein
MDIKDLYATYGQLTIQEEILRGQILHVKKQIANELDKQQSPVIPVPETVNP